MTEYGIFNDEGCVERGFWTEAEAHTVKVQSYWNHHDVMIRALCPDHDEQPLTGCEDCADET